MTSGSGNRGALALVGIVALATALTVVAAVTLPVVSIMGRWVADFRVATLLPHRPPHPDIVVLAITEQTLERFPYRTPIDRGFLDLLLRILEAKGARAIGVDVLFDQRTEAAKDEALRATIRDLRVPLVISYGREDSGLTENQLRYLDDFVPFEKRGFANLDRDEHDGTVRWIYPGRVMPDGRFLPSLPIALAEKMGYRPSRAPKQAIAWYARPDPEEPPFRIYPAHVAHVLPEALLKGKVVLIGADQTLTDRHRTPFSAVDGQDLMPGVLVHAHALAQLMDGRRSPEMSPTAEMLVVLAAAALAAALGSLRLGVIGRLFAAGAALAGLWVGGFWAFKTFGVLLPVVTPSLGLGLSLWLTETYHGRRMRQQRKFVTEAFARYVAPELVAQMVADPTKLKLSGERREMTFLFSDVAGFTSLSERSDPERLGQLINAYFDGICQAILRHGGTVVEFIGDSVFAVFGAPLEQPDHAERAVAAAREMDRYAEDFRRRKVAEGVALGVTRIGVHSGSAVIGNFGSEARFKYVPIGDAVNTASRVEGLNKHLGTRLMVSATTVERCRDRTAFRPVATVLLKGKAEPLGVFEPVDEEARASPYLARYRDAYALLMAERWDEAEAAFSALQAENPEDPAVRLHLSRLRQGQRESIVVMTEK